MNQLLYDTSARLLCQEEIQISFFEALTLHQIIVVCGAVLSLSAADLHYITRFWRRCQHFFEKVFISQLQRIFHRVVALMPDAAG